MKFISALVTALAWPLSAFFIVNLFKREIIERIPRLSELTLPGGISAKFNAGLAKVEAAKEAPPAEPIEAQIGHVEDSDVMVSSGTVSEAVTASVDSVTSDEVALRANPTGVAMEAWKALEVSLRSFALELIGQEAISMPITWLISRLYSTGKISWHDVRALQEMLNLRNLAAHSNDPISETEALKFSTFAREIASGYAIRLQHLRLKRDAARPGEQPSSNN